MPNRKLTSAIILHHTAGNEANMGVLRGVFKSRFGVNYVGYNRVIFTDGTIDSDIGDDAHGIHNATGEYQNYNSVGVSLVGNFSNKLPGINQLNALSGELDRLRVKYSLGKDKVFGHKDFKATACPGAKLYQWLEEYKQGGNMREERVTARTDANLHCWQSWNEGHQADVKSIRNESYQIEDGKLKQGELIGKWKLKTLKDFQVKSLVELKEKWIPRTALGAYEDEIRTLEKKVTDLTETLKDYDFIKEEYEKLAAQSVMLLAKQDSLEQQASKLKVDLAYCQQVRPTAMTPWQMIVTGFKRLFVE